MASSANLKQRKGHDMEPKGLNPVVRALLGAVVGCAIVLAFQFVRQVLMDGGTFSPGWGEAAGTAVLVGLLTYFGPDAAQRKRNRENLGQTFKDSFGRKG